MEVVLRAEPGRATGSSASRRLRRDGKVPAVVYGRDVEPTPVAVSARELNAALRGEAGANVLLRLDVDGAEHLALARQIQRHPWKGEIRHVDFITVTLTETVEAEVAIHLEGESVGVQEGGIVETVRSTVRLAALVTNIPSAIALDISELDVGDHLRVADLPALEGVEYLDDPDELLVTVVLPAAEIAEEAAEGEEEEGIEGEEEGAERAEETEESSAEG
jgi:large subunit ribosomal protein L25